MGFRISWVWFTFQTRGNVQEIGLTFSTGSTGWTRLSRKARARDRVATEARMGIFYFFLNHSSLTGMWIRFRGLKYAKSPSKGLIWSYLFSFPIQLEKKEPFLYWDHYTNITIPVILAWLVEKKKPTHLRGEKICDYSAFLSARGHLFFKGVLT